MNFLNWPNVYRVFCCVLRFFYRCAFLSRLRLRVALARPEHVRVRGQTACTWRVLSEAQMIALNEVSGNALRTDIVPQCPASTGRRMCVQSPRSLIFGAHKQFALRFLLFDAGIMKLSLVHFCVSLSVLSSLAASNCSDCHNSISNASAQR